MSSNDARISEVRLGNLLNSDMATLAQLARRGLEWWRDELAAMLPTGLAGGRRRLTAFHRLGNDGAVIAATTRRVDTLVIPAEACFVRQLDLPRLPTADLAALIALDADRILPITADQLITGIGIDRVGAAPDDGASAVRARVTVGALPIGQARAIAAGLAEAGLAPRAIGPLDPGGTRLAFDLAPAMRAAGLLAPRPVTAQYWWAAVAALALVNLGLAVLTDQQHVTRAQTLVDAQAPALGAVRNVEDRLRDNARLLDDLAARRDRQQPLRVLAALDRVLPDRAWIERLEWDRGRLRLTGFAAEGVDVVGRLKASGAFHTVRASRAEAVADTMTRRPFDLTATTFNPDRGNR